MLPMVRCASSTHQGRACPCYHHCLCETGCLQYVLAVAVYEWLCGARPFDGTYAEIAVQHVLHDPPSLCRSTPDISPEVEAIVLKALAKDPHQRFSTVQEFASALELAHQSGTLPGELKSAPPA